MQSLTPIRILHLDDSSRDAEIISHLLTAEDLHCVIVGAANRKQFEASLAASSFDVVLCDYDLPDIDGLHALKLAKESFPETPVIIVSGAIDAEAAVQCLKAGATDYLLKQRLERLPSAVRRALEEAENDRQHKRAEEAIRKLNASLEQRVRERTAELEATLNELREAKTLLLRNDKLTSLGRMSAGLIHEVNNPLNYAAQGIFLLNRSAEDLPPAVRAGFLDILKDVDEGISRVVRIVSDLRGFTGVSDNRSQALALKPIVDAALRFFSHEFTDDVGLEVDVAEGITVWGDSNEFVQVIVNVVQNGLEAVRAKSYGTNGAPAISLAATVEEHGVVLKIRDNGPGIPPTISNSIFDPFFTTKDVGKGVGLGLTICHRILADYGGEIEVHSKYGEYSEFILSFRSNNSCAGLAG